VTWGGLGLSYFTNRPVGFCITTIAFAVYVFAREARALTWPRRRPLGVLAPKGAG
jgi:ABC-type Mn2+/Zn2+ transport system permease subunit